MVGVVASGTAVSDQKTVKVIGEAVICGIALYIIFTVPLVYAFGAVMGIGGVWWAQLAANICVLSIALAAREVKRLHALQAAER